MRRRVRGAVEGPAVDGFLGRRAGVVARAGDLDSLPAEAALGAEQAEAAEDVAALQRQAVVEDVKDGAGRNGAAPGW
jgi:hypothetical protein